MALASQRGTLPAELRQCYNAFRALTSQHLQAVKTSDPPGMLLPLLGRTDRAGSRTLTWALPGPLGLPVSPASPVRPCHLPVTVSPVRPYHLPVTVSPVRPYHLPVTGSKRCHTNGNCVLLFLSAYFTFWI